VWKFSLSIFLTLSLIGCREQLPADVVAARPSVQTKFAQKPNGSHLRIAQTPSTPSTPSTPTNTGTLAIKPLAKSSPWIWPAKGSAALALKGMDIAGSEGAPVLAANSGEVVYSGNSLRGYGNLIIIKHSNFFISAYAHNRKNMVKEGEHVSIGQRIAEMGRTGTDKVKLHFEVRYKGKPIDPYEVLPSNR